MITSGPSLKQVYTSARVDNFDDSPTPVELWIRSGKLSWLYESSPHFFRDGRWQNDPSRFCTNYEDFSFIPSMKGYSVNSRGKRFDIRHTIGLDSEVSDSSIILNERAPPTLLDPTEFTIPMNNEGANLYRNARPGNPVANLAQFLFELRDYPRMPRGLYRRLNNLRKFGDDYLNIEFGWKPFLLDMKRCYNLATVLDKRLGQLIAYNAKWIKRKRRKPPVVTTSTATQKFVLCINGHEQVGAAEAAREFLADAFELYFPGIGPFQIYDGAGLFSPSQCPVGNLERTISYTLTTAYQYRFTGEFFYYVPDIGSWEWTQKATAALFGAYPTPEVLWEVLPWSWLINWFTNVGDLISNASVNAVENELSMNTYCYYDEITRLDVVSTISYPPYTDYGTKPGDYTASCSFQKATKVRKPATPYGFGVAYESLSTSQLAILAALGLSRQRFI